MILNHWHKYIKDEISSESFIIPFFPVLESVFLELKKYRDMKFSIDLLPDAVLEEVIFHDLGGRIIFASRAVFVEDLREKKQAGLLKGLNSKERLKSYIEYISDNNYVTTLFIVYPVLKKVVYDYEWLMISFYKEIINHLSIDWHKICRFFFKKDFNKIIKIERAGGCA